MWFTHLFKIYIYIYLNTSIGIADATPKVFPLEFIMSFVYFSPKVDNSQTLQKFRDIFVMQKLATFSESNKSSSSKENNQLVTYYILNCSLKHTLDIIK